MVPIEKVKDIISQYDILEKELSSGNIDAKLFAKKNNMKYTEAIKSNENRIAYYSKKMILNIDNKKVKKQF